MDPTINKTSTGKERTVRVCTTSENTTRGPLRARYMSVLGGIHVKIQSDKENILEDSDVKKKRLMYSLFTENAGDDSHSN